MSIRLKVSLVAVSGVFALLASPAFFRVPRTNAPSAVWALEATGEDCAGRFERIRKVFESLPEDFRTVSSEAAERYGREVLEATEGAARFLRDCAKADNAAAAQFYFAKGLYLLSRRRVSEVYRNAPRTPDGKIDKERIKEILRDYYDNIARHAKAALARLPEDSPLRPEGLRILGWASARAERYVEAREAYQKHLKEFPHLPQHVSVLAALGRVYLEMGVYDPGIELLRKALKDPKVFDSPSHPHLMESLWKLLVAKGDPSGMLQWCNTVLTAYPLKLASESLRGPPRDDHERILDYAGFRKGVALLALGNPAEAEKAFEDHIRRLNEKEKALRKQGQQLKPESAIYRQRSERLLAFLRERAGKPAPRDFDLDDMWATPKKARLADARGKVFIAVFRGVGDDRSAGFLARIDDLARNREDVELLAVAYLKPLNAQKQLDEFREELARLDYEHAAGFDPDATGKSIFRAYDANVGSATVIVFDRNGRPVWYQQDPRELHVNLVWAVVERLRKSAQS